MSKEQKEQLWVMCLACQYEMDADLKDSVCEQCGATDWSEPYNDDGVVQ